MAREESIRLHRGVRFIALHDGARDAEVLEAVTASLASPGG